MKAEDVQLTKLLSGPKQFVIPVFQRDYSWGTRHCLQLWNDVIRVGMNEKAKAHFVGSVVYIAAEDTSATITKWLLIDGQQRLTTVTILLAALRAKLVKMAEEGDPVCPEMDLPEPVEIDDYYLRNQHAKGDRKHKLMLRRADQATLEAYISGTDFPDHQSDRIRENYVFFRDQLDEADLEVVYQGIRKLVVVDVALKRGEDDPQMIFESLNSTGLDLTQADLIRNFVLMRQTEERQTELYQAYWHPIEKSFGSSYRTHFDRFIQDYLNLELRLTKPIVSDEVYTRFKEFYGAHTHESVDDFLSELKRFAIYYAKYNLGIEKNSSLHLAFERLRKVADIASPVMLVLYDAYDRLKSLTESEFVEAAGLLESYVLRRSVCDLQTRSLGVIFLSLALRIKSDQPLETLKVALYRQGDSRQFPSDSEFMEKLVTRELYKLRNCAYILDRLENDSKEKIDTTTFTVEHVMPQTKNLNQKWVEMLGQNWAEIQRTWLHRLGNLTLTGYNSSYSDRAFEDKKSIKGGFNESPLRLNSYIKQQSGWLPQQMEERGIYWAKRALSVWPALNVDPVAVKQAELEDHKAWSVKHPIDDIPMDANSRELFNQLRPHLLALGEDIHELGQSRSVVYRVYDFVVEVIPRKGYLYLNLNLEMSDLDPVPEHVDDLTIFAFVRDAKERGSVGFSIWSADRLPVAIELIKRAYERVTE